MDNSPADLLRLRRKQKLEVDSRAGSEPVDGAELWVDLAALDLRDRCPATPEDAARASVTAQPTTSLRSGDVRPREGKPTHHHAGDSVTTSNSAAQASTVTRDPWPDRREVSVRDEHEAGCGGVRDFGLVSATHTQRPRRGDSTEHADLSTNPRPACGTALRAARHGSPRLSLIVPLMTMHRHRSLVSLVAFQVLGKTRGEDQQRNCRYASCHCHQGGRREGGSLVQGPEGKAH